MSLIWSKDSSGPGGTKARGTVAGGSVPSGLSRNPVVPTSLRSCDGPGAVKSHADDRPDFATRRKLLDDLARAEYDEGIYSTVPKDRPAFNGWRYYVYCAGWGVMYLAGLFLFASVAKAIRYGVITDIINWMLHR